MIAPFSARKNPAWAQRLTLTTELTPTDSGKTVGWRQGEDGSCAKQTTCEGAVLDDMPPEDQLCLLLCRAEPSPVAQLAGLAGDRGPLALRLAAKLREPLQERPFLLRLR